MNSRNIGKGHAQVEPEASGQGLVEFALLLPVLILLFVGIADLGQGYQRYILLEAAAREGARYGTLNPYDTTGIQAHALSAITDSRITATATPACLPSCASGNTIRVTVTSSYTPLIATIAGFSGFSLINLSNSIDMVIL